MKTDNQYRISQYSYFKELDNKVIGVSFIKQIMFAIDNDKYALIKQYENHIEQLQKINAAFYSTLYKLGVITSIENDNALYDTALLKRRITVFRESNYRLTINPTLNCNVSCWYCYETHTKHRMERLIQNNVLKFIEKTVSRPDITSLELDWFGGEPLLCYANIVKPISIQAQELCNRYNVAFISGITTNGSLLNKNMLDFFKAVNMQSFQITLDGPKYIHDSIRFTKDKCGTYDKIVSNLCLLARELAPTNLSLRINFTSDSINKIPEIIDSFPSDVRANINILLQQVWQNQSAGHNEIDNARLGELRKTFAKAGFKVEKKILNYDNSPTCYADYLNQAVINYDGRVFKCTAMNFEREREDGILTDNGEILWSASLAKKVVKATFENEYCKKCKYLPLCYGPCHKKMLLVGRGEDFQKYCFKDGIKDTLDYLMTEFAKTGQALAPLLELS